MGFNKDDKEVQTDNKFILEYEEMIENQKKSMQTLQKDNSQLQQQITTLQNEIQKLKEKVNVSSEQKIQSKGSFLMSPQKPLKSDHIRSSLHHIEDDEHVGLIQDIIQKDDQFENAEISLKKILSQSPDPSETRQTTQITNKKNLITNKDGVTIKRDSQKPNILKKKRVFDRLFQDSKDKANRLELLKKHLDQMESFQWEEVLTMLNLYSKEPDQNNDEALIQLQQKLLQDKFVSYEQRNQAANREKNLKDFVLNQQFSSPSSPQTEPMQNQCMFISTKLNKQQRPLTKAEYFYRKQNGIALSGSNTLINQDGNVVSNNRKQSSSPNNQKECEENIVNTFQEINQDNFEKKKQYMDQLYDNFKKHNNRIKSSLTKSHNTSQDENQMKITLSDKKKRFSHLGKLATEESKGLQFYDTSDQKKFYTTTSNNKKQGQYNLDDFQTIKNQQFINSYNPRTHSLESPRNNFNQNTKKRVITSSQENKRIVTKRTVINTEKVLKQKEEQKEGHQRISDRVEKIKNQIKTSMATNNSLFIPDSIFTVIKGKAYQMPQQNSTATSYSQNVNNQTITE